MLFVAGRCQWMCALNVERMTLGSINIFFYINILHFFKVSTTQGLKENRILSEIPEITFRRFKAVLHGTSQGSSDGSIFCIPILSHWRQHIMQAMKIPRAKNKMQESPYSTTKRVKGSLYRENLFFASRVTIIFPRPNSTLLLAREFSRVVYECAHELVSGRTVSRWCGSFVSFFFLSFSLSLLKQKNGRILDEFFWFPGAALTCCFERFCRHFPG